MKKRYFTIIEALAVITILSILTSIIISSVNIDYAKSMQRQIGGLMTKSVSTNAVKQYDTIIDFKVEKDGNRFFQCYYMEPDSNGVLNKKIVRSVKISNNVDVKITHGDDEIESLTISRLKIPLKGSSVIIKIRNKKTKKDGSKELPLIVGINQFTLKTKYYSSSNSELVW